MARYIDADKTLDMMWNALYQYEDDMEKKNGLNLTERLDVQNGFEIAHKVVVDAPTEDVAPVIHAHWVVHGGTWAASKECSNCAFVYEGKQDCMGNTYYGSSNYCPDCGAVMDE